MTLALWTEFGIGLLILGGWFTLAFLVAVVVGKVIRGPRPDDFADSHPDRERLGLLETYEAERLKRIDRAMARKNGERAA